MIKKNQNIKNNFSHNFDRWRITKYKKLVVSSYCSVSLFFISIATSNIVLANDIVANNALPQGQILESGNASFSNTSLAHNVNLQSDYVKASYSSFNIGRDASVNVNGNLGNTFVARVRESGNTSHIYGQLNAPGVNLFLLNSSGIVMHGSSQVNVGSLAATTAKNFSKSGDHSYEFTNFGNATIINNGDITVANNGFAILAAPHVKNTGVISANLGRIELASANADVMKLDLRGDDLISFQLSSESLEGMGVNNTGTIIAKSGVVSISAHSASSVVDSLINLDGVIDADAFEHDSDGGVVLLSSAGDLNLNDVTITASASQYGDGGKIYSWADGVNTLSKGASLNANGGELAGDGGFIDLSGNNVNISFNDNISAAAPRGKSGTFLIDPDDITIKNGANPGVGGFDANNNEVYEQDIESISTAGTNVIVEATNSITLEDLDDNVLQGADGGVTLKISGAGSSIVFDDLNDSISTTGGDVTIVGGPTVDVNIGNINTHSGNVVIRGGNVNAKNISTLGGDILPFATGDLSLGDLQIVSNSEDSIQTLIGGLGSTTIKSISHNLDINQGEIGGGSNSVVAFFGGDVTIEGDISLVSNTIASNDGGLGASTALNFTRVEMIFVDDVMINGNVTIENGGSANIGAMIAEIKYDGSGSFDIGGDLSVQSQYSIARINATKDVSVGGDINIIGSTEQNASLYEGNFFENRRKSEGNGGIIEVYGIYTSGFAAGLLGIGSSNGDIDLGGEINVTSFSDKSFLIDSPLNITRSSSRPAFGISSEGIDGDMAFASVRSQNGSINIQENIFPTVTSTSTVVKTLDAKDTVTDESIETKAFASLTIDTEQLLISGQPAPDPLPVPPVAPIPAPIPMPTPDPSSDPTPSPESESGLPDDPVNTNDPEVTEEPVLVDDVALEELSPAAGSGTLGCSDIILDDEDDLAKVLNQGVLFEKLSQCNKEDVIKDKEADVIIASRQF